MREGLSDRLQVRLNGEAKQVLQRAAQYRHETLSQFVLATALAEAHKIIQTHETTTLSLADWQVFYDALEAPPEPNENLRSLFSRYLQEGA